jgi:predicted TIM-barrel fold metal-dependent hydrolase
MRDILLAEDYWPRSELVVPEHHVPRARFPVVDAHNHLPMGQPERTKNVDLDELVRSLDYVNVQTLVNLSGGWGDELKLNLEKLDHAYPGRFVTFCNVDWAGVGQAGWLDRTQRQLEADVAAGARGLKVFKTLGLAIRDDRHQLVMPDDPRIAEVWEQAGELGVPVLIHVADPVAFFRPLDRLNERWDELHHRPEWLFYGPQFPSFQEIIDSLYATIEAHPNTTFITAHVGCYPENLAFVSQMLVKYPNMYTDISARLAELGRAPYSARRWFLEHADRILFGTDQRPRVEQYRVWFRALETDDEHFDYVPQGVRPGQGRWKIYGLHLPDDVLHKVYHDNAARLLGLS